MKRYVDFTSTELIRACAGMDDQKAWTEFMSRFQAVIATAVLRTARLWGDASQAPVDDLVQDTCFKLCEKDGRLLRAFEPQQENSIYGFLKVVAANVAHDHFKSTMAAKRGVNQTLALAEPFQEEPAMLQADSFDIVSHRLQIEKIDKVLTLVTSGKDQERKRTIFWLRHQQGLTASEIASIPAIRLTTEGVESVLLRLAIMIRSHLISSGPHREVKALPRKNRSKRVGS